MVIEDEQVKPQVPEPEFEELIIPASWTITIKPAPIGDARFIIRDIVTNNKVSVFLDFRQALKVNTSPYWEVFRIEGKGRRSPAKCLVSEGSTRLLEIIFTELNGGSEDSEVDPW